jgi:initiation factor 1A
MVKNSTGGKKSKQMGRKLVTANENRRVRLAEGEGEVYGIAVRMLGNGMFQVHCADDVLRLCRIRGKFSGRLKGSHLVKAGVWVLVGLYEWNSSSAGASDRCDLLEVYNDREREQLQQTSANFMVLRREEGKLQQLGKDVLENGLGIEFEDAPDGEIDLADI